MVLATDGDFNVGVTSQDELVRLIEEERASGVFLSVLGVGTGNLKDSTMEKLADKGNGNYAYLDSLHEARKVLVREAGATLTTIAKDVKIQVEFNPKAVAAYRLIGYENRVLRNEDFNDDKKDAGEIGAGHSVTALYEIVPAGAEVDAPSVDPLRYQQSPIRRAQPSTSELATVKVRYKAPDGDASRLITTVVQARPRAMSPNLGFASAVAEFGMLLTGSEYRGRASYESALARARTFRGSDPEGYRAEFVRLVDLAAGLRDLQDRVEGRAAAIECSLWIRPVVHGQPRCLRRRTDDDPYAIPAGKTLIGDRNVLTELIRSGRAALVSRAFGRSPNGLTSTFVTRSHSRTRAAARFSAARDVAGIPWCRGHSNVTSLASWYKHSRSSSPSRCRATGPASTLRSAPGCSPAVGPLLPPVASRIDTAYSRHPQRHRLPHHRARPVIRVDARRSSTRSRRALP